MITNINQSKILKRKRLVTMLFLSVTLLLAYGIPVYADTADDIMKKIDEMNDIKSSAAKVAMIIYPNKDDKKNYRIVKMISYGKGKDISFSRYVYPNSVKGMKMLTRGDDIWTFFASTGRKRKIASYNKKQSVEGVGGDFNYQDMSPGDWRKDFTAKIISQNDKEWTLELKPVKADYAYTKMEFTVTKGNYRTQQIKYYDDHGFLKALFFSNYKKIDKYDMAMTMTMVNYRKNSKTIVKNVDIRVNVAVDEKYFDANQLESN